MVDYKKSKKGYFYKVVRGKSVRISEQEFKRKSKRRIKKNKNKSPKPPKISAKEKKAILDEFGPLFHAMREVDASRKQKGGSNLALEVGASALVLTGLAAAAASNSKRRRNKSKSARKEKFLVEVEKEFSKSFS